MSDDPEKVPQGKAEPIDDGGFRRDGANFAETVLASSLNGIYVFDRTRGANVYINAEYTRITGYTLDDLGAMGPEAFFGLFHPEDRERISAHLEAVWGLGDGEVREIAYRFRASDGRWIWCRSRDCILERDPGGGVRSILGTFLDVTHRTKAERELERQKELLGQIVDTIPVMLAIYDPEARRFRFNEAFRSTLGWTETDMAAGDPMEKFYPDPVYRSEVLAYMRSLEPGWRDFRVTAKSGEVVESSWANKRLSDDTHIGIGIDMRERKAAERRLRRSEERLSLAMEAAGLGFWDTDPRTGESVWSVGTFRMLGLEPAPEGRSHTDLWERRVHPDDVASVKMEMEKARRQRSLYGPEYRILRADDGRTVWLQAYGRYLFDEAGEARRFIGVYMDITAQKEAETELLRVTQQKEETLALLEEKVRERTRQLQAGMEALQLEIAEKEEAQEAMNKLSRVFQDAADPIIVENAAGTIVALNREAERVYGWQREELLGKSIKSLIPENHHTEADELRRRCLRGEEVRNVEQTRLDQHGRRYAVLVTAFPLADASGTPREIATIVKDISIRKQMEAELKESRRRLRELSRKSIEALESDRRSVAVELHDSVGADLALLKFRLEDLRETMAGGPPGRTEAIDGLVSHLAATIKSTKRVSTNLRPLTLDDLGLAATIEAHARQFRESSGITLVSAVDVDERRIPENLKIVVFRVIQEALHNAARHSGAERAVLRLKMDRRSLTLEVEDDGAGFDPDDPLLRNDPLSGFGLANMSERAEICGGRLTVDASPGEGTRIRMRLPLQPHETEVRG